MNKQKLPDTISNKISKRKIAHVETLIYYDGPQLFIAKDTIATHYLCLLAKQEPNANLYLIIPASINRINTFTEGIIDLRTAFQSPEITEYYSATITDDNLQDIEIQSIEAEQLQPGWLPAKDLYYTKEVQSDEAIISESTEKNKAIIHVSLNPPESRSETTIDAERLAQAIKSIQRVIGHAFHKALQPMQSSQRNIIDKPANYDLQVFAFSSGSFTIHFQTKATADMLGYSEITKAFIILDHINDDLSKPEATVDLIAEYGGHFAASYRDLLKFIVSNETPISYEWATPDKKRNKRKINLIQAKPIYEILSHRDDIGIEKTTFNCRVTKADRDNNTWKVLNLEDDKHYSGKSAPGISLDGITLNTQLYEFTCEEHLSEDKATGRETINLILTQYRLIS